MENKFKTASLAALLCSVGCAAWAQTQPFLSISNDSPVSGQIGWANSVGTTYRVFFTTDLSQPLVPVADAFSEGLNVSFSISTAASPVGFYAVEIPTNGILPEVQIFSPTNGQTISGPIVVGVGAQIGSQLQGVDLYMDNALVGYVASGGIQFYLDTSHFTNGLHTLYVSAVDTGNNQTQSDPIILDFENPIRWLDPPPLFKAFVPINVQSDIFPADWSVFVADTNGTIIRTFSGSTSDGEIQTNWDGNDNNGVYAPDQAA